MKEKQIIFLHKYFYSAHQVLWTAFIDAIKQEPDTWYNKQFHLMRIHVTKQLFGKNHFTDRSVCFGCYFARQAQHECSQCFLNLNMCEWWHSFFKIEKINNVIKICETVKDCGYTIIRNDIVLKAMDELYKQLTKEVNR